MQMTYIQTFIKKFNKISDIRKQFTVNSFSQDLFIVFSIFLPIILIFIFKNFSFAYGVVIISFLNLYFFFDYLKLSKKEKLFLFLFLTFLILHFILSYISTQNLNIKKFLITYISFIFVYCSASSFYRFIKIEKIDYSRIFNIITYILIFLGILQIVYKYISADLRVFPFKEMSHYALTCSPFFLFAFIKKNSNLIILILFLGILSFIMSKNLTLLLLILICVTLLFNTYLTFILIFFFITLLLYYELIPLYFSERLLFWKSESISAIVYNKGWEVIFKMFNFEYFFGSGFQQSGYREIHLLSDQRLEGYYDQLGEPVKEWNNFGFALLAAKIIFEFGIFGLLGLFIYIFFLIKNFIKLKLNLLNTTNQLFAFCCLVSLFIELFFRGVGYFSINFYLSLIFYKFLLKRE